MALGIGLNRNKTGRKVVPRIFPWRIFYRFVVVQAALVLVGLAASGLAGRYFFKGQFLEQVRSQLKDTLSTLALKLPSSPDTAWCSASDPGGEFRISVMGADGTEICESRAGWPKSVGREPEVADALKRGFGENIRYSDDLGQEAFFGALASSDRRFVVRGAIPLTRLSETMRVFDTSLSVFLVLLGAALIGFALWSARQLVFPLGRLLLKTQSGGMVPEPEDTEDQPTEWPDEWSELESNIDDMRRNLMAKSQSLTMEQVELDTIMGAISDAILAVDPDGTPLFFNSRFELLFGGGETGLRERQAKLWTIFRDPEILSEFRLALKEGKRSATKAIPLEQKEGLKSFFSLSVSPLRRHEGTIYGAVGIFHDVTELKSAEQMRIDFVANVSHELRTPLTAIKGYVDTLIQDIRDGKSVMIEFLDIIARNTERLLNLMNDLLDLSAIESADILQKDPLSTRDLTERIVKQLQGGFDARKQIVSCVINTPTVVADSQRVEQVLVNLLNNANKYTPAGSRITVLWEKEGRDVLLKVADTGPGIPVEHHSRLFERFYRVDKARAREQGGTGLGLAIVKHIMQRHEGSIWVESRAGEGATFVCRFPGPGAV